MQCDPKIAMKIGSARRSIVALYLRLLEQATLLEGKFDHKAYEKWVETGKLENEWRQAAARKYIQTWEYKKEKV